MMKQIYKNLFTEIIGKEVRSYYEFTTGYNNINIAFNDAYVLRVPKTFRDPTINFNNEKESYEAIDKLNISEKLVHLDVETGVKITKYVHNAHIYYEKLDDIQIKQVSKTIKKLHKSNIKVDYDFNMFDKLQVYKNGVSKDKYLNEKYEKNLIKKIEAIYDKEEKVFCHNDLVQNNVLFRFNDIKIIDWETAAMNHPYFDLASFISENNLNNEQKDIFLQTYFGCKINNLKIKRVQLFEDFLDVLFYYWAEYFYENRKEDIYKEISSSKLNRIKTKY